MEAELYTQITSCFKSLHLIINKSTRDTTQQQLARLSDDPAFIRTLVDILTSTKEPDYVKMSCAAYVSNVVKRKVSQKNPDISKIIEELLIIIDSDASMSHKSYVSATAFSHLFKQTKQAQQSLLILSEYFQRILAQQYKKIQNMGIPKGHSISIAFENPQSIRTYELIANIGMQVLANITKSHNSKNPSIESLFQNTFQQVLQISVRMMIEVETQTVGDIIVDKLQQRLVMMKSYALLIKKYFQNLRFHQHPQLITYTFKSELEQYIARGLSLTIPNNNAPESLLSCSKSKNSMLLNVAKQSLIELLLNICESVRVYVVEPSYRNVNPFFKRVTAYANLIINSLVNALKVISLKEFDGFQTYQVVGSMLDFLNWTVKSSEDYYQFIFTKRQDIFMGVIQPFFLLTQNQISSFDEDPEEFINHMLLIMRRGAKVKNGAADDDEEEDEDLTLQMKSAQVFGSLCRYQDGFLIVVLNFCFQTIQRQKQKIKGLSEYSEKDTTNKSYQDIFRCLILIGAMASNTAERPEVLLAIRKFLQSQSYLFYSPTHNTKQAQIQRCLMMLLIYRFLPFIKDGIDNVFPVEFSAPLAIGILDRTILADLAQPAEQMVALLLLDQLSSLNTLVVAQRCGQILQLFLRLLELNSGNFKEKIFQSLYDLIQQNHQTMIYKPDHVIRCFRMMIEIVTREFIPHQPLEKQSQIIINKCWNIIRATAQYMPTLTEMLEAEIGPLVALLRFYQEIDFQEDVVILVSSLLKHSKKVTQNTLKVLEYLPALVVKNKFSYGYMFTLVNMLVLHGTSILEGHPESIKLLLELSLKIAKQEPDPKSANNEADKCQGVLILENLVVKYNQHIQIDSWIFLLENLYLVLSQKPSVIKHDFLKSHFVVLLGFSFVGSLKHLKDREDIQEKLLNILLTQFICLKQSLPSRLFCLALIKTLDNIDVPLIRSRIDQIFDTLVTVMRIDYNRIKAQEILSEDAECYQEQQDKTKDQQDYEISIKSWQWELKDIELFELFKQKFSTLKETHEDLLRYCGTHLAQEKKMFLNRVMSMVKVGSAYRPILQISRKRD